MSGETEASVSGWTVDTLNNHLVSLMSEQEQRYEQRFQAQENAVAAALLAAERAVQKAEIATEKRFEGVNEFRKTLADQTVEFVRRSEIDPRLGAMADKQADFGERLNRSEGNRTGQTEIIDRRQRAAGVAWGAVAAVVAGVGLLVAVVGGVLGFAIGHR